MRGWHRAASVAGTKGLEGRLRLIGASAFLASAAPSLEVAFVPPRDDAPRFARVLSFEAEGEAGCTATFTGVDDINGAERLIGCTLLVKGEAPPPILGYGAFAHLVGFAVMDEEAGLVGIVTDVSEDRVQPLIHVARPVSGEALIPFVDAIVKEVDEASQVIQVTLPVGLLDI